MHSYSAFGLNIHSEIRLSRLAPGSPPADVHVRRGSVTLPPEWDGHPTWTTTSDIYFPFRNIGTMQISRGEEIVVDASGVEDEIAEWFLLGPAMGALLHQRGQLVLHASAVAVNGGVVAFLGRSGWGKSTMAATLVKLGNAAFSDDLVPVSESNGVPVTLRGYPFYKLGNDSGRFLGYENSELTPVIPHEERRHIAMQDAAPNVALPLACIYVLAEAESPEIEPLKPQDAALELIRHSYVYPCLRASGMSVSHLKACARLVDRVPVRRLRRPRRLQALNDVAEFVQRDLPALERSC